MNASISQFHNPQNLTPEEYGGPDGFRLLTNEEAAILTERGKTPAGQKLAALLTPQMYLETACRWAPIQQGCKFPDSISYRTSAPLGQEAPAGSPFIESALADFVESFNYLSAFHHDLMIDAGFWGNREKLRSFLSEAPDLLTVVENAMDCQLLALITTEVSETVEAVRHGNPPDDKIPQFSGAAAELADVMLRLMDLAHERQWPVAEAMAAKLLMNATRPKMHGGKLF